MNWVKISGSFTAQGGETCLTIGSFKDGTHVKKIASTSGFNTMCNTSSDHHYTYFYIDDVSLYACNPIGVVELDDKHKFKIYPNPAKEQLTIEADIKRSDQTVINIYNIMGEIVLSEKISSGETAVNTSTLKNGTYLYRIIIDGNIAKADKLIIIK
ncbi:MAG: T9SS type A sorting domain-containing protein [Bacteroidota bacterium]